MFQDSTLESGFHYLLAPGYVNQGTPHVIWAWAASTNIVRKTGIAALAYKDLYTPFLMNAIFPFDPQTKSLALWDFSRSNGIRDDIAMLSLNTR
jgi:hypothetical protein